MNVFIKTDFWLGLLVFTGGIWAYFQSRTFGDYSRNYSLFLSVVFVVLGFALIFKTLREPDEDSDKLGKLFAKALGPLIVAMMMVGWGVLLLLDIGYIISSIIILPPVLWLLGYRDIKFILMTATGIVAAVFVLFRVLFDVPLPLSSIMERIIS